MINFHVNTGKCIHCGACAADCPMEIIKMQEGIPVITHEDRCLRCQHCLAVCPTGALSILGNAPEDSLPLPEKDSKHGDWFEKLVKGRRSVRRFLPQDIPQKEITKLLDMAWHAPTGHNDQSVRFAVVHGQKEMGTMREEAYSLLGKTLNKEVLKEDPRTAFLGWALYMWNKKGKDVIFRDAPNLLLTHAPKNATSPREDCIIALTTFDLAAQAAGLGTLWDGFATWAIGDFCPGLTQMLGIPEDHVLGYAMIFGKPAMTYHRTVNRGPAPIHWASLAK